MTGVRLLAEAEIFLFSTASSLLYNVYRGDLSSRVKRQGHEADHSSLSNAEAKNDEAVLPLPDMSSWLVA
jgi:hypothetical protein